MTRAIATLLILLLLIATSGCWDMRELNDIGLVLMLGIDTDPKGDGFEVTVHVHTPLADPGGEGSTGEAGIENITVLSARGQTIMDCFRNLRGRVAFRLSFHHVRLLVIGEDLARKGIKPAMDFMIRTQEIRINSLLLVSEGPAKELLQTKPEVAESLHLELEGILRNEVEWSKTASIELSRFFQHMIDPGRHAVASRLFTIEPEVSDPVTEDTEAKEIPEAIVAQGLAVFNDDQLAGWLTGTETTGYRYMVGLGGESILVVPWHGGLAALEVNFESCSKLFYMRGDTPVLQAKIMTNANLVEYTGYIDLANKERVQELEKLAADQLAGILYSTDEKAKALGVDIMDYGGIASRRNPRLWAELNKNWREIFPTIETIFDVRMQIDNLGIITTPLPR
ncbi:MAG: Ger(x)C family spore germination protein [Firmicutes bacterium]|nr:Ger(x)C family spore germination protein [Bacillota bacterium]